MSSEIDIRNNNFFWNKGTTFWIVEKAESVDCFNKEEFCFVDQAFADRDTAVNFINSIGFGGKVISPGGVVEIIEPLN